MAFVKSAENFKNFWANPNAHEVHQPKQRSLFMLRMGDKGQAPACGFGMAMRDERTNTRCVQTDAFDDDTNGLVWYVKSVSKPSIKLEAVGVNGEFNEKYVFGSTVKEYAFNAVTWEPLKIKLIDPSYPNATRKLLRILRRSGFGDKSIRLLDGTYSEGNFDLDTHRFIMGQMQLYQYIPIPVSDPTGYSKGSNNVNNKSFKSSELYVAERWFFNECILLSVNFGSMEYGVDDLLEIDIEVIFGSWQVETYDINDKREIEFKYNKDYLPRTIEDRLKAKEDARKLLEDQEAAAKGSGPKPSGQAPTPGASTGGGSPPAVPTPPRTPPPSWAPPEQQTQSTGQGNGGNPFTESEGPIGGAL